NPPDYLRQDMTVSVDIEVEHHRDVLTVPAIAVHDPTGSSPWVLKVKDRRAVVQAVRLGLRGETGVEIREGLDAGDLVVATAMNKIKPGQRLRPMRND